MERCLNKPGTRPSMPGLLLTFNCLSNTYDTSMGSIGSPNTGTYILSNVSKWSLNSVSLGRCKVSLLSTPFQTMLLHNNLSSFEFNILRHLLSCNTASSSLHVTGDSRAASYIELQKESIDESMSIFRNSDGSIRSDLRWNSFKSMRSRLSGCRLRGRSSPGGAGIVLYSTACSPSWLARPRSRPTGVDFSWPQLTERDTGAWSDGIIGLVFTENYVTASITLRDTTKRSSSDIHLDNIRYVKCP